MSRRSSAQKRNIIPDAKFGNIIIAMIINAAMRDGKKTISEKAVYSALEHVSTTIATDPVEVIEKVIENVKPVIAVRSRRVGGASYQVPMNLRPEESLFRAIRALINAARNRKDKKTFPDRLAAEMLDAIKETGGAFKKKEETHKMAEANKAFAHFNW